MLNLCSAGLTKVCCGAEYSLCRRCPLYAQHAGVFDIEDLATEPKPRSKVPLKKGKKAMTLDSTVKVPSPSSTVVKLSTTLGLEQDSTPLSLPATKMRPLFSQRRFQSSLPARSPSDIVSFSSMKGKRMFAEALNEGYHESYFRLSEQYQTEGAGEANGEVCLSMILNALRIDPLKSSVVDTPVWKGVWRWFSADMLSSKMNCSHGTFSKFSCLSRRALLHENDCSVSTFTPATADLAAFRVHIQYCVSSVSSFLVTSFDKTQLFGEPHDRPVNYSPIAGYHPETDSVLILDVDRRNTAPYWVPLSKLYASMKGYCIFQREAEDTVERLVKVLRESFETAHVPLGVDEMLRRSVTQTKIHNHVVTVGTGIGSSEDLLNVTAVLLASTGDIFMQALPDKQQAALWWMKRSDASSLSAWLPQWKTQLEWQSRTLLTMDEG
eukprot:TRINITY_DN16009_c0_g1_i2.p1 TRINITY_DN16009_c0_g1~~TRINITY_DN16009_c0_g1_i2.p1  ORF type:complete len:438 (+),score=56.58 TRINITY_DN16009_c0_g1_i2:37-1350(+)